MSKIVYDYSKEQVFQEIKELVSEILRYFLIKYFIKSIRNIVINDLNLSDNTVKYTVYYTDSSNKSGILTLLYLPDCITHDNIIKEILIHER